MDFSVVIPTYNGEKRLGEVLEQLRSQQAIEHLSWEILVIDNNSTDNTAQVVQEYQNNWSAPCDLKYYFETQQGAAFARSKGVKEAKGELIGFLDDDNIPACDWIAMAYSFSKNYPKAGAYGSRIKGEFEVTPPPNFEKIAAFLALTDRGDKPLIYQPETRLLPPSAGLVVRKQVWVENVPDQLILTGRKPGSMLTSEDLETLSYIQKSGWEIWYNPDMRLNHKIPAHRLQKEYLLSLFRGIGLSRYVTRMISYQPWQRPWALLAYLVNDIRKILLYWLKNSNKIKTDVVIACQMQLYISSLISPFYIWKEKYLAK